MKDIECTFFEDFLKWDTFEREMNKTSEVVLIGPTYTNCLRSKERSNLGSNVETNFSLRVHFVSTV